MVLNTTIEKSYIQAQKVEFKKKTNILKPGSDEYLDWINGIKGDIELLNRCFILINKNLRIIINENDKELFLKNQKGLELLKDVFASTKDGFRNSPHYKSIKTTCEDCLDSISDFTELYEDANSKFLILPKSDRFKKLSERLKNIA